MSMSLEAYYLCNRLEQVQRELEGLKLEIELLERWDWYLFDDDINWETY